VKTAGLLGTVMLLAGLSCGDPDDAEFCRDAPVATYENFGHGFLLTYCQPCHGSEAVDRQGAPDDVTFDDQDQVEAHRDRIQARSVGEAASMPPSGGVLEDDLYLAEVWLRCF